MTKINNLERSSPLIIPRLAYYCKVRMGQIRVEHNKLGLKLCEGKNTLAYFVGASMK